MQTFKKNLDKKSYIMQHLPAIEDKLDTFDNVAMNSAMQRWKYIVK